MFIAKFKVLDIIIPIGFMSYCDHGFIDSVYKYLSKFEKDLDEKVKENVGICIERALTVHIAYENMKSESYNIKNRAHEETHALSNFGRLDLLEKKNFEGARS